MNSLATRLNKLNPFSGPHDDHEDEDAGRETDVGTLAGGGHAGRTTEIQKQLRVSQALRHFLVAEKVITGEQAGVQGSEDDLSPELRAILELQHISVPPELTDRSHNLANYFISSSHNTYLLAHQLYGNSSAEAYKSTLRAGARCVEIDAWDGDDKDEPKVTHGYTLTSDISFRSVCEAIRDVVDEEQAEARDEQGYRPAPILISLENHCDAHGQKRMVEILTEVLGDRLLSQAVRDKGTDEQEGSGNHVRLSELGSKVAIIVEYHFPGEPPKSEDSDEEGDDRPSQPPPSVIIPELAELGVYAQSVKPPNDSWFLNGIIENSPHHPLINVSESKLSSLMPSHNDKIIQHNANHLMRVYPKGLRISSANLHPTHYWGLGAQICALNWQTFGASLQLNEALFSSTDGYVLKPPFMRDDATSNQMTPSLQPRTLRLHIAGATDIPIPSGRDAEDLKPYVSCLLDRPFSSQVKRKTAPYKQHKLGILHKDQYSPPSDPLWCEVLEWPLEAHDEELAFLRLLVKSDDAFAANPILAVNAVRLRYIRPEWVFIRLLDLKGHETRCSLCVKIEIVEA